MSDSRVTPDVVEAAELAMMCDAPGVDGKPTYWELAEAALAAAAPLLCQPLQDEIDRLTARNAELTCEVRHEQRLLLGEQVELWRAVHDRQDAPDPWLISRDELICAVQDMHRGGECQDEIDRLRAAIRARAERWRNYQPGGFYPEASAYANAIENCGDALIDLLDELAASPVGTGNPTQPRADD